MTYRLLDLFSGIGGFSLGLERTGGFQTVAFCEINSFCRKVLRKHWSDVPIYEDIRTLTAERLRADGISVDAICGGFPCQDISVAGKGAGIEGERSGLWSEYARLIGELRPRIVIVENVAALLGRGLARVLGDLAALGFDAEWHCIPASSIGAPHRRDRLWIVARAKQDVDDTQSWGRRLRESEDQGETQGAIHSLSNSSQIVADTLSERLERRADLYRYLADELAAAQRGSSIVPDTDGAGLPQSFGTSETISGAGQGQLAGQECGGRNPWLIEPDVGRVAHGVPARVDRLRSLGNAVVPQIPEVIGHAILSAQGRAAT